MKLLPLMASALLPLPEKGGGHNRETETADTSEYLLLQSEQEGDVTTVIYE